MQSDCAFDGRVINRRSPRALMPAWCPGVSILEITKWYVVANFRERELRHMAPGSPATVYLSPRLTNGFARKVQGIGWADTPEGESIYRRGCALCEARTELVRVAHGFCSDRSENPDPTVSHGRISRCDYRCLHRQVNTPPDIYVLLAHELKSR